MAITVTRPGGSVTGDWESYLPGMTFQQAKDFIQNSPYATKTPATWDRRTYSGSQSPYPWTKGMPDGMTKAEAIAAIPGGGYTPGQGGSGEASGMTINDIYARMRARNQAMEDSGGGSMYTDQQMGINLPAGHNDYLYDNNIAQQMYEQRQQQNRRDSWNAMSPTQQANNAYSPQMMQRMLGLPQLPSQAQAPNQTQAPGNPFAQQPPQMPPVQQQPGTDYLDMPGPLTATPPPQMPPIYNFPGSLDQPGGVMVTPPQQPAPIYTLPQQPGGGGLDMQRQSTLANALRNTTAGG